MSCFNFNKVVLGGRLTADLELKQTPNGVSVLRFTVAVNRKAVKDKAQETDFITCVAWRQTAEFVSRFFRKGSSICVVGNIQTRKWTDQSGQKKYATEVIVDEAIFVDGKNDGQGAETANGGAYIPVAQTNDMVAGDSELPF